MQRQVSGCALPPTVTKDDLFVQFQARYDFGIFVKVLFKMSYISGQHDFELYFSLFQTVSLNC